MTERVCKTCASFNPDAKSVDDAPGECWNCASQPSLPGWRPIQVERRISLGGPAKADPLKAQVGGDHYKKLKIQPMEYSMANGLDACQHTVIKYVTRFRDKGGMQDLEKAKHAIDLLIQFERAKASPA